MTATEKATQEILKVTGNDTATDAVKAQVAEIVGSYYGAKGGMQKEWAVGLIVDALGLKYGQSAGKIAMQLA